MTPGARLQATIEILNSIEGYQKKPASDVVNHYCKARRYIGAKDRRFIKDIVFDILRHRTVLDWWSHNLAYLAHTDNHNRERVLTYLVLYQKASLKDLLAWFDGEGYQPTKLTIEEENYMGRLIEKSCIKTDMPIAVKLGIPQEFLVSFQAGFPTTFERECRALLEPAPLDLRVNTLKAERDFLLKTLSAQKIPAVPTYWSPIGIRINERIDLRHHPLYTSGAIEIQDEGSQLLALLCDVHPSMRVLDLCAGAGGKTLALAALMKNQGEIIAADIDQKRLNECMKRAERAGATNITPFLLEDEEAFQRLSGLGPFDRIIVDAPCSGSGTWRRQPDLKWRTHMDQVLVYADLQLHLL